MLSFQPFVTGFALADISGEDRQIILWLRGCALKGDLARKLDHVSLGIWFKEGGKRHLTKVPIYHVGFLLLPCLGH